MYCWLNLCTETSKYVIIRRASFLITVQPIVNESGDGIYIKTKLHLNHLVRVGYMYQSREHIVMM